MRKECSGFFLIQLALCLTLVTILCSYTIPSVNFLQNILARMHVELLCTTIRATQWHAISHNIKESIIFYPTKNQYSSGTLLQTLPKEMEFGAPPGIHGPPSNPSKLIQKPVTFVNNEIICHPNGIISSGTIYIKTKNDNNAYAISNGISTVSNLRMYRHQKRWKLIE